MANESKQQATTPGPTRPYVNVLVTYICVLLVGMCLAWTFLSMRAVAGVGGSCASGGSYEIVAPCPDGSWLIALAIPLMLLATFSGSGFAMTVGAPALLLPMWALLFTSLGWNFWEFGLGIGAGTDVNVGFIVCGVVFIGMGLPAWWAMFVALRDRITGKSRPERNKKAAKERAAANAWSAGSLDGSLWWWAIYAVLGSGGAFLGVAIYALAAA